MEFKQYPSYKPSGVEWLGDVPDEWDIYPFWHLFNRKEITNKTQEQLLSVYLDRGVILHSEGGGMVHKPADNLEKYQLVEVNDFVMNNQQAWRGSVGVSPYKGIVSPAYLIFSFNKKICAPKFFKYFLRDKGVVDQFMNASMSVGTIQRQVKWHLLKTIQLSIPSLIEQNTIANFLDTETARIDNLISKQEKLIELLEEQRKSIISHAVTKGLNPNAPMKDSGVEWLGEVPEHWEQKPIWSMFARTKRTNHPNELLLSVYRDYGVIPKNSRDDNHNRASEDLTPYQLVNPNDLVINKMKAWQGSIAISEHRGIVSPAYYIYEPKKPYYSKYIHHLIRSVYFIQSYKNFSKGIRVNQWDLEHDAFTHINLLLPPLTEQQKIVSFLDSETSRIDILIAKQEKLIEKLKEYRSSIISHAVTGKIDVREFGA